MTGMIVLIAALATTAEALPETRPYAEAYQQHRSEGKPLVVLVGASWCPACRTMSTSSLPAASRNGTLRDVAFAVVDVDHDRKLAEQLMRGSSVPQLIMYYQTSQGPRRVQLTGAHDADAIARFVQQGQAAAQVETPTSVTTWNGRPANRTNFSTSPTFSTGGS